uniref:Homeobox domain-containing protein n=1 Tax=Lates calcarifer TaxID=8187 RepID=A0A4W6F845_LATCA
MANFSVEWLSRSYYEEPPLQVHSEVHRETEEFTKEPRREFSPTSPNSKFTAEQLRLHLGSESEVGDDSEGEATQQRRMRTKFTSEQISTLENTFSRHKYLGATQRKKFAEKLNLSETQVGVCHWVKTWFQNRRMKLKREVQDLRPAFLSVPAALLPASAVSAPRPERTAPRPQRLLPAAAAAPQAGPPRCPAPRHPASTLLLILTHSHPPKSCLESRYFIIALCQRGVCEYNRF